MGEINAKHTKKSIELLNSIIEQYRSIREFARTIEEDPADIFRWRAGKRKINPRAVIKIVREHPEVQASDLNSDVFLKGMTFTFNGDDNGCVKGKKTDS